MSEGPFKKQPIFWTEMLTKPSLGIHTVRVYYDDGSVESYEYQGSPIIIPRVIYG